MAAKTAAEAGKEQLLGWPPLCAAQAPQQRQPCSEAAAGGAGACTLSAPARALTRAPGLLVVPLHALAEREVDDVAHCRHARGQAARQSARFGDVGRPSPAPPGWQRVGRALGTPGPRLGGQQLCRCGRRPARSPSALSTPMPKAIVATTTCAKECEGEAGGAECSSRYPLMCNIEHCPQRVCSSAGRQHVQPATSPAPVQSTEQARRANKHPHPHFTAAPLVLHLHTLLWGHACGGARVPGRPGVGQRCCLLLISAQVAQLAATRLGNPPSAPQSSCLHKLPPPAPHASAAL